MKRIKYPVALKILLPLVSGIILSHYFGFDIGSCWLLILFACLTTSVFLRFKNNDLSQLIFGFFLFLFFLSLGIYRTNHSDSSKNQSYFAHQIQADSLTYLHLTLREYPSSGEKWIKCEASVNALNERSTTGSILVFLERDSISEKLIYGDQIYASGFIAAINPPMNPNEFDYQSYMKLHDIHHQIFIRTDHWRRAGNDANPIFENIYSLRNYCAAAFEKSGMNSENIAVAKALVLGDKALISDELMLSYASTGALHVLAVSGLHVGIIMLILSFILKPLKRIKKAKFLFLIFALSGIWFYAILTGLTPSVLRAAVMFSFVLIGSEMQRDTSIYQSLMISATVLLLFDPNILFQLGFLLSYFAVIGIVFFHPKIYALLFFKNKIADKIWQVSSVSMAAQLATFPLGIYCFQQFPNYFLVANLIVIPLSFLILILGIVALIVNSVPILNVIIFFLLDWLIFLLNHGVRFVENLPFAVLDSILITWYDAIFLYLFIIFITYWILTRSKVTLQLSLLFLTAFFVSDLVDTIQKTETNQVVFYQVKNEIVTDVFTGRDFRTITTLENQHSNKDIDFHVNPNRIRLADTKEPAEYYTLGAMQNVFSFENKTIHFANQTNLESIYFPKTDALYLYDCKFISGDLISQLIRQKTFLILGHGCTSRIKKHLTNTVSHDRIYDITSSGALIIRF